MTSRFPQQKPDPTIKKNVINARQGIRKAKREQIFVVAASLAATLLAGVFFSQQDAQVVKTTQPNAPRASAQRASSNATARLYAPGEATPYVQQTTGQTPTPPVSTVKVSAVSRTTTKTLDTPAEASEAEDSD